MGRCGASGCDVSERDLNAPILRSEGLSRHQQDALLPCPTPISADGDRAGLVGRVRRIQPPMPTADGDSGPSPVPGRLGQQRCRPGGEKRPRKQLLRWDVGPQVSFRAAVRACGTKAPIPDPLAQAPVRASPGTFSRRACNSCTHARVRGVVGARAPSQWMIAESSS